MTVFSDFFIIFHVFLLNLIYLPQPQPQAQSPSPKPNPKTNPKLSPIHEMYIYINIKNEKFL